MILIERGAEPIELEALRKDKLAKLRTIIATRPLDKDDIDGYRLVSEQLWRLQHNKCCYCERDILHRFNDVEHYRPKLRADRHPGSTQTHGYWWLAFTWQNLLYACASCNRAGKNDQFPLDIGDIPLIAEASPPGQEHPLLLDPGGTENPVKHIQFVLGSGLNAHWWARPRNGSNLGNWTIKVCDMNHSEHIELRQKHITSNMLPQVEALKEAIHTRKKVNVSREFERAMGMLTPTNAFVGLNYDVFCHYIPNTDLKRWRYAWPAPTKIGLP